ACGQHSNEELALAAIEPSLRGAFDESMNQVWQILAHDVQGGFQLRTIDRCFIGETRRETFNQQRHPGGRRDDLLECTRTRELNAPDALEVTVDGVSGETPKPGDFDDHFNLDLPVERFAQQVDTANEGEGVFNS